MTTLVQFLRWAHPLIGTIVDMCTISNAMGLILVHRPSVRKNHASIQVQGGQGAGLLHLLSYPLARPRQLLQLVLKLCLQTVSSCVPSGFSLRVELLHRKSRSHRYKSWCEILPPLFWYHDGRYRNDHGWKHVSAREGEVFFWVDGLCCILTVLAVIILTPDSIPQPVRI
ncbi:uncharacterized protein BJ212DRAFT_1312583 [Suillus subaureus]|uniref:Uncharacterized protein n=1 Tax=Suillus subaureus TaxID=48587 RepID=A0A9P7EQG6_9AGAM|nr:uncharacterized protein BJ212DRAFT_1312583 [Suillus subaureus]KAG1827476.1 hypothetical protein BJ212DRAFT_1312583 [Suillus subaureus]